VVQTAVAVVRAPQVVQTAEAVALPVVQMAAVAAQLVMQVHEALMQVTAFLRREDRRCDSALLEHHHPHPLKFSDVERLHQDEFLSASTRPALA
jgi:heme exporter protein D